jgi:hypothetical protein
MEQSIKTNRKRNWGFLLSVIVFALSYIAARGMLEQELATGWKVTFALLPLPPFVYFLLKFIQNIRTMDEMERRINLEALAIAFPLCLVLIMTLGLLELAIPLNPNDWSYRHILPFVVAFYFIGMAIARKKYL